MVRCVFQNDHSGASLVAQWLGVHLLMQGTRVRALVWEDPTLKKKKNDHPAHGLDNGIKTKVDVSTLLQDVAIGLEYRPWEWREEGGFETH